MSLLLLLLFWVSMGLILAQKNQNLGRYSNISSRSIYRPILSYLGWYIRDEIYSEIRYFVSGGDQTRFQMRYRTIFLIPESVTLAHTWCIISKDVEQGLNQIEKKNWESICQLLKIAKSTNISRTVDLLKDKWKFINWSC